MCPDIVLAASSERKIRPSSPRMEGRTPHLSYLTSGMDRLCVG
jgi:hypothetical protein